MFYNNYGRLVIATVSSPMRDDDVGFRMDAVVASTTHTVSAGELCVAPLKAARCAAELMLLSLARAITAIFVSRVDLLEDSYRAAR